MAKPPHEGALPDCAKIGLAQGVDLLAQGAQPFPPLKADAAHGKPDGGRRS